MNFSHDISSKKTSPIFHLPTDFPFGGIMADSIVLTFYMNIIKIKFNSYKKSDSTVYLKN